MHNPLLVVAIAAYVTLIHLGMLVGMSISHKWSGDDKEKKAIKKRRTVAAAVAYVVALAATLYFAIARQSKAKTHVTYWATLLIMFFGLSYAVYTIFPKVYASDPTPEDQKARTYKGQVANVVHALALLGAAITWFTAKFTMKPLPTLL